MQHNPIVTCIFTFILGVRLAACRVFPMSLIHNLPSHLPPKLCSTNLKMSSTTPPQQTIPSRSPSPDLPLTLASSLLLTNLPRDASTALQSALTTSSISTPLKITVRFKAIGSAPMLRQSVCKISSGQKFEAVVAYLRRVLGLNGKGGGAGTGTAGVGESVFCYVNSSFAPSLDEVVGNLWRVSFYDSFFPG